MLTASETHTNGSSSAVASRRRVGVDPVRHLPVELNRPLARLVRCQRGGASLEYLTVFLFVSLGIGFALRAIGPDLVALFQMRVAWLALPLP